MRQAGGILHLLGCLACWGGCSGILLSLAPTGPRSCWLSAPNFAGRSHRGGHCSPGADDALPNPLPPPGPWGKDAHGVSAQKKMRARKGKGTGRGGLIVPPGFPTPAGAFAEAAAACVAAAMLRATLRPPSPFDRMMSRSESSSSLERTTCTRRGQAVQWFFLAKNRVHACKISPTNLALQRSGNVFFEVAPRRKRASTLTRLNSGCRIGSPCPRAPQA